VLRASATSAIDDFRMIDGVIVVSNLMRPDGNCCPGGSVVNDNVYRLMALPQISAVLTVNSSVAHEAPYFGKRVHALLPLPIRPAWHGTVMDEGAHLSLDDIVLTPDFRRTILAPHTTVTTPDAMRLRAKPNRMRIAFDSFWNYQQIDTDRITREHET
jgi:hypothetical protein